MREQIRVRVDSEQWSSWREGDENNTEQLTRILNDWQQLSQTLAALTAIDPNPAQALGRLLTSHELLSTAVVTIHPATTPPVSAPATPAPQPPAAYDDIDGIENNGDDW